MAELYTVTLKQHGTLALGPQERLVEGKGEREELWGVRIEE